MSLFHPSMFRQSVAIYILACFHVSFHSSSEFPFLILLAGLLKCKKSLMSSLLRKQLRLKEVVQWQQLLILVETQSIHLDEILDFVFLFCLFTWLNYFVQFSFLWVILHLLLWQTVFVSASICKWLSALPLQKIYFFNSFF